MKREQFIQEVSTKLRTGMCDLFVGSGISAPSEVPTWSDFLKPFLEEINIQLKETDDFPLLAQYYVNENSGNRNSLVEAIHQTFGKAYKLNSYHKILADLPVKTVWTTNYDDLLERAFCNHSLRVIASEDTLLHPYNSAEVELIKLHGCAKTAAHGIVLTRADYNGYFYDKPKLTQRLREAVINRSFFFIGYSYQDPDIQEIMTQAYYMKEQRTNSHYILLRNIIKHNDESKDDFDQRIRRFKLWISELNRIGIRELVVQQEEIESVLREIDRRARAHTVFVTGNHKAGVKEKKLAGKIGNTLAKIEGVTLNSGQSVGIGNATLSAFMEYVFENNQDINQRVQIFPNPYAISPNYSDDPTQLPNLKMARLPMISNSSFIIAFPGGMGTMAEIELALKKNRPVFPVILDDNSYNNTVTQLILSDSVNAGQLRERIPNYYNMLKNRAIPKTVQLLEAVKEFVNAEKERKN